MAHKLRDLTAIGLSHRPQLIYDRSSTLNGGVRPSLVKCSTAVGVPRPRVPAHGIPAIRPSGICAIRTLLQQRVAIARRQARSLVLPHTAD
jgi:hypothetical protein